MKTLERWSNLKIGEKLSMLLSNPQALTILVFALVIAAKAGMILGGGYQTDGDVIG